MMTFSSLQGAHCCGPGSTSCEKDATNKSGNDDVCLRIPGEEDDSTATTSIPKKKKEDVGREAKDEIELNIVEISSSAGCSTV